MQLKVFKKSISVMAFYIYSIYPLISLFLLSIIGSYCAEQVKPEAERTVTGMHCGEMKCCIINIS